MINAYTKLPNASSDLAGDLLKDQRTAARQKADNDDKLKALLQGKQMDYDLDVQKQAVAQQRLEDLFRRNPKAAVSLNGQGGAINPESARDLGMGPGGIKLTPAQEAAEKKAGVEINNYETAGGRPALEKDLASLQQVQQDLAPGDAGQKPIRDKWDRNVGGLLSGSPALMGLFASKEKERRDKARNTANRLAKQTDPNPTEKQVDAIMGQIYDPSSSNEENAARIDRFLTERQKSMDQLEAASRNYHNTGYVTIGNTPAAPSQKAPGLSPAEQAELARLRQKHGK